MTIIRTNHLHEFYETEADNNYVFLAATFTNDGADTNQDIKLYRNGHLISEKKVLFSTYDSKF